MQVQSLNKFSYTNKFANANSVMQKRSDSTLKLQLNRDKICFGNTQTKTLSEAERYVQKLEEILIQKKVTIREEFNKILLIPTEQYLADAGLAIELRTTKAPLPNEQDFFASTLSKYKASLAAHPNEKQTKLQKELLPTGKYNPKQPSKFVDLTPNLAKISLLSELLPKFNDLRTLARINFMVRSKNEILRTIYDIGTPNLFPKKILDKKYYNNPNPKSILLPEDLQSIYKRLLPETLDLRLNELEKLFGLN